MLTGPEAIGFGDVASYIGQAIGGDVQHVPVRHEAAKEAMLGMGFPEWIVDGFVELAIGFENNFANTTTDGVEMHAGHVPRSFKQFAVDVRGVWQG